MRINRQDAVEREIVVTMKFRDCIKREEGMEEENLP
jgi:hypothetical protein